MSEEKAQETPQATGGDDVQALIRNFRAAQLYRRWVTRGVVIAILVVVLVGILSYYRYGKGVVTDLRKRETQEGVVDRLRTSLVPDVEREVKRLYDVLGPKIIELAKERAEAARPEITSLLDAEQKTFQANMEKLVRRKLEEMLTKIIEDNKATLKADFPDITDPEKMEALVQLLVDATHDAASIVFVGRLDPHIEVLEAMDHKIKLLPVRIESNKELLTRFGELALELLGRMKPVPHEGEAQPAGAE